MPLKTHNITCIMFIHFMYHSKFSDTDRYSQQGRTDTGAVTSYINMPLWYYNIFTIITILKLYKKMTWISIVLLFILENLLTTTRALSNPEHLSTGVYEFTARTVSQKTKENEEIPNHFTFESQFRHYDELFFAKIFLILFQIIFAYI